MIGYECSDSKVLRDSASTQEEKMMHEYDMNDDALDGAGFGALIGVSLPLLGLGFYKKSRSFQRALFNRPSCATDFLCVATIEKQMSGQLKIINITYNWVI